MNRAFVGDLKQPLTRRIIEIAGELDGTFDPIDLADFSLALSAIFGMDLVVAQTVA